MIPAEQLRAAKALIDAPEKWTKGNFARDSKGRGVAIDVKAAASFCAVGALGRVGAAQDTSCPTRQALIEALPTGWEYVNAFNDHSATTHADIMKLFDDAIALAEAGQ